MIIVMAGLWVLPNLAAGVWVGGEDMQIHFRSMHLGQGAYTLPIWGLFMQGL